MQKLKMPGKVNLKLFDEKYQYETRGPQVKYGLPPEVRFCKKCVISNQRPNSAVEYKHTKKSIKPSIAFNKEGVCDACLTAEKKKKSINWAERDEKLRELCNKHRSKNGSYDCIVPGSGGKDSFFAAHKLKYEYGMHPLTVTWAPHIYTTWGQKNFQSWIQAGFDNYLMTPNGRVHRLLTRLSTENLFHPFQPFMIGQKSLAPKMAALFGIPLVFFGENEVEYGNPLSDSSTPQRDNSYFTLNSKDRSKEENLFLGGQSIASLREDFGLEDQDFLPYLPLSAEEVEEKSIEVHYLGYYLKWHPQSCYYYSVEHGGFEASPERTPGTYSKYNSIDDKIDDFHYYTTGIKFGIGRATYDAAQEVRSGDITREEAQALVKKFDLEFPERFADTIFEYLSLPEKEFPIASKMFENPLMDRAYFDNLTDHFRSPHIWSYLGGKWSLKKTVWQEEKSEAR